MAKGWSFGALTDALKSAAFRDVGVEANQVLLNDPNNGGTLVRATAGKQSQIGLLGNESNNISIISNYGASGVPANDFASFLRCNWYNNSADFGVTRGAGANALGATIKFNGTERARFDSDNTTLWTNLHVRSYEPSLFLADVNGNIAASLIYRNSNVNLATGGKTWVFKPNGSLELPESVGEGGSGIRVTPEPGSYASWNTRAPGVQVDIHVDNNESMVWRATRRGALHVAAMGVVRNVGSSEVGLHVEGSLFKWTNEGDFLAPRTITANALVSSGGVIRVIGSGNKYVWFNMPDGSESALVFADTAHSLNFRCAQQTISWKLDGNGFRNQANSAGIDSNGLITGPGWGTTGGYDGTLATWVNRSIDGMGATKISQDNCRVAGFVSGDVNNPYMRQSGTEVLVSLATRNYASAVATDAANAAVNNRVVGDSSFQMGFASNNKANPYMKAFVDGEIVYLPTRAELRGEVAQKVTRDGVNIAGFEGNNAAVPYFRHESSNALVYLATKTWATQNFVTDITLGAEGGGIIGNGAGQLGNPAKVPTGCVMTGWFTEGQTPGGDTIYYRPIQKVINGVRTTIGHSA